MNIWIENNLNIHATILRHRVDSNHHKNPCGTLSIQFDHNAIYVDNNKNIKTRF